MNKVKYLLLSFLFLSVVVNGQTYQWAKRIAGTSAFDVQVNDVIVDQNVYVGGSFSGTVDFDPGAGVSNRTANGTDGFIAKYDHGGNLLWVYSTNASGNQQVTGLNLGSKLNAAVQTSNSSISLIALETANASLYASTSFSTSSAIKVNKMAKNSQTVLYVVGGFSGNFQIPGGPSAVGTDAFLMSFTIGSTPSTYFSLNFLKGYGGNGYQEAFDVSVRLPVIRFAGVFEGTCTFPSGGNVSLTSAGGTDGFVIDLNSLGDPGSLNKLRIGTTGNDGITCIDTDPDTRAFAIGGYFSGAIDFDPTANDVTLTSSGLKDGFVARYGFSTGGVFFSFAKRVGGTFDDEVTDVSVSPSGAHPVYYAVSNGAASGSAISTGAYDSLGTAVTFGGLLLPANQTTVNKCNSICVYNPSAGANPDVYLGGVFNARTDFNPGAGVDTIPAISGGNNGFLQKFSSCAAATQPVVAVSSDSICPGLTDTLSITSGALNGNANWVWYAGTCGGTQVGVGPSVVVTPSATTNYYARGEGGCATTGACSVAKTVIVKAQPPAPVIITSGPTAICAGEQVFYSLIINNLSAPYTYQWRKNGVNVSGATNSVYYPSAIANNDVFSCVVTGSNSCGTIVSATSTNLTVTVTSSAVPVVTIATANSTACSNTNVTFTSTVSNGGTTPTYQWLRNNVSIFGATSSTLVINSINLGSTVNITCVLTSSLACASPTKDTSNALSVSVIQSVTPSITITPSATTICATGSVTFSSAVNNNGTSPTYTWQKNGVTISGATLSSYTASSVNNGDVFRCIMASSAQCANPVNDTSNSVTITVTAPVTPSVIISASSTTICAGGSVTFTATPTNGGSSPTYQWQKNGSNISGATSATYTTTTLAHNDVITCILTSNAGCVTAPTATSNSITITVSNSVVPVVSVSASNTTVCAGTSVTFTATPVSGAGNAPTYQWKKNGNNISGATSATYVATGLAANDVFSCVMTSNATCASPATATSNTVTINVTPAVTPAVTISTPNSAVCAGTTVVFTATPVNGGASPTYVWKRNGNVQSSTSATYSSSSLVNNDVITCELTSNAQCASPVTANSNPITITINPLVNAGINIAATQTTICTGNSVTFTATPVNGGSNPVYQWRKNGASINGATSATYTTSTLANGDNFTCDITSNANCLGNANASSNIITITVSTSVTPAISISAPNTTVCAGASVTFTATPTNGGSSPGYQWRKNGSNIAGATSATYTTSSLANNDAITCVLTSSVACASPTTATSNTLQITVNPTVAPAVTIATPNTTICAGTSITFIATPVNGGTNPTYTWRENGVDQGTTTATYTVPNIADGTIVSCVLQSTAACASPATANSNNITVTVNPQLTPTVSITASQTTICAGGSVTFTATSTNGGSTPAYQWKKNGSNISGATSATYTASGIADGDVFTCQLTSNAACLATNNVTSNSITISISGSVTPSVVVTTSGPTTVCAGATVNFTAVPTNGGSNPVYQWKNNGVNISGATTATYNTSALADGDVISCVLTSSVSCASPQSASSNTITMDITPVFVPTVTISGTTDTMCENSSVTYTAQSNGSVASFQWTINGVNAVLGNSIAFTPINVANGDTVRCIITSLENCANPLQAVSQPRIVTVLQPDTVEVTIATGQATTCAGSPVSFTTTVTNGGDNPLFEWSLNGNEINGANGNSYTSTTLANGDVVSCIVTSSETCVANTQATSNSISITIVSSLTASVSIATAQPSVCQGSLSEFTATGINGGLAATYIWSINGVDIQTGSGAPFITLNNLNNNDTIRCKMLSSENCVTQAEVVSAPIVVTVNALPDVTVSVVNNTLTVPASATHQWYNCGNNNTISGATNATYTATANGDYKVAVTNTAGCTDTSVCVNVNSIGIEDATVNTVKVSPNPFSTDVTISVPEFSGGYVIEVYNCIGAIVKRTTGFSAMHTLQLTDITSGIYFIKISNGAKSFVKRIEKQQ